MLYTVSLSSHLMWSTCISIYQRKVHWRTVDPLPIEEESYVQYVKEKSRYLHIMGRERKSPSEKNETSQSLQNIYNILKVNSFLYGIRSINSAVICNRPSVYSSHVSITIHQKLDFHPIFHDITLYSWLSYIHKPINYRPSLFWSKTLFFSKRVIKGQGQGQTHPSIQLSVTTRSTIPSPLKLNF